MGHELLDRGKVSSSQTPQVISAARLSDDQKSKIIEKMKVHPPGPKGRNLN